MNLYLTIPLQSETVLSSLIHSYDSIPQVLVGTNEPHNDLRKRRSTIGFAFTCYGGAIVYKSKTQDVNASSSTEAEFIADVTAAKTARYIRSMLNKLGFP